MDASMDQAPNRKRPRFQFTLGQLLALTLGVALGFAPLKVWELTAPANRQVLVAMTLLEVPADVVPELGLGVFTTGMLSGQRTDRSHPFHQNLERLKRHPGVKEVTSPTLTTLSGRPTRFNIGGEVPIPVTDENGLTTIEYREYGTQIDLLPTILRNGRIQVAIDTKLSTVKMPPDGNAGDIAAAFNSVSSTGEIELADGETVVFGGLPASPDAASDRGIYVFVATVRSQN
jgi:Flp pilus assembly secretin CpaC